MNKKVSTLLTVALTLGGSLLSSSAFADTLPIGKRVNNSDNKFVNGGTYFIVQDDNAPSLQDTHSALGYFFTNTDQTAVKTTITFSNSSNVEKEDIKNYLWKVTEVTVEGKGVAYNFYNEATGMYLLANYNAETKQYTGIETSKDADAQKGDAKDFAFYDWAKYEGMKSGNNLTVSASQLDNVSSNEKWLNFTVDGLELSAQNKGGINLYSVADEEIENPDDSELNALYNRAGFNFKIKEGVANIFGEGKVKAICVKDDLKISGTSKDKNNPYYSFPAGTYFATETPVGSYPSGDDYTDEDRIEYLKGCTFIAVDPDNNVSGDGEYQKAGKGFTLTTVPAQDLNFYTETAKGAINSNLETSGSQISVFNACFVGWQNATKPGQYALALNHVRYQKEADKDAHEAKDLAINVISVKYGSTEYLATDAMAKNYVFTLEASSAVNPADKEAGILKENAAAIYNIKFVSGDASDHQSEYGKYLTFTHTKANSKVYNEWWAKGEAIVDLNTPAYQFVVSKVNGNDITFTNRETGESFTAQLFEEEDGVYSLALSSITKLSDNGTNLVDASYKVADVSDKGDVTYVEKTFKFNDALIELEPVTDVDKFDGFLNVEDETIMTLAFARDFTPTSNKLYPVVDVDTKGDYLFTKNTDKLTDEVSESVEFMLVKDGKPKYTTHNYYYLNDAGKVMPKNWGDTVAVQPYKMQLVFDGTKIEKEYIAIDGTNISLTGSSTPVVIKNNPDGSVAIMTSKDEAMYLSVSNHDNEKFSEKSSIVMNNNDNRTKATDVKTYLFNDSPVISWKAERGHVTLQTEMGNYITANEDNAGIVTSNEAETFYLHVADTKASVPSFFISKGKGENSNAESERMFLFNPVDSVPYLVNAPVDTKYQWDEKSNKAIFKSAKLNATADTLTTSIKGKNALVAQKADNKNVQGGLDKFKFQIIEAEEGGYYYIRQVSNGTTNYLRNLNGKLTWTINRDGSNVGKSERVLVAVKDAEAPTSNESVAASEVKVIANNGSINIKNAAGKNVVVSTILGQVVANEVLTSDNATINVPAGIVVVAVEGESFKVNVK